MSRKNKLSLLIIIGILFLLSLGCGQSTSEKLSEAAKDSTQSVPAQDVVGEEIQVKSTATKLPETVPTEVAEPLQLIEKQGFYQDGMETVIISSFAELTIGPWNGQSRS
jgi:hypothetical protein